MWKTFSVLAILGYILGLHIFNILNFDAWSIAGLVLDGIGVFGLAIYAFSVFVGAPSFWKNYAYIYAIWVAISLIKGIINAPKDEVQGIYIVIGLIIAILWQLATLTALFRLGRRAKA